MKNYLPFIGLLVIALNARAEIQTITFNASVTNQSDTITISENQTIELKTQLVLENACGISGGPLLIWNVKGTTITNALGSSLPPMIFSGPASVWIAAPNCPSSKGVATFDIQPAAFPPDKAMTLGAYSGNVQVTMEESTDLVNWTPSTNGEVHTNAPEARFFRIKMVKNAAPAP